MDGFVRRRGMGVTGTPDMPVDAIVNIYPSATHVPYLVHQQTGTEFYARLVILETLSTSNLGAIVFGGSGNTSYLNFAINTGFQIGDGSSVKVTTDPIAVGDVVEITTLAQTSTVFINGVEAGTYTSGAQLANSYGFGVFRKYSSSSYEEPRHVKFGVCEIYYKEDDDYVFHLLPYLGADGRPYLYDEINGTKHYNEIGAPFGYILNGVEHNTFDAFISQQNRMITSAVASLPSRYTAVNCIISQTTGRIDTGTAGTTDMLVRCKLYVPRATGDAIIGDATASDSKDYRLFNANNGCYLDISNQRINKGGAMPTGTYDVLFGDHFVYNTETNANILKSSKTVSRLNPWACEQNIRILRNDKNRDSKIYYFAITNRVTNEPIMVMTPCYDTVGQEYGMYDAITEQFYGAEQGSFTGE